MKITIVVLSLLVAYACAQSGICIGHCQGLNCCGAPPYVCCSQGCCGSGCCPNDWSCVGNSTADPFCCVPDGTVCGDDCYTAPCTCGKTGIQCPTATYGCNGNGVCSGCGTGCQCKSCECYADSVHGHWAGPTCERCAMWYYSTNCNTPTTYAWVLSQNITGNSSSPFPSLDIGGTSLLVDGPGEEEGIPAPTVYQLINGNWKLSQTLEADMLQFSGIGAMDSTTMIQLASDSSRCYAVFYEEFGGQWKAVQTVPLSNEVPTPCQPEDTLDEISVDINNGVAAIVLTVFEENTATLVILTSDNGNWSQGPSFNFASSFYFQDTTVAVGDGIVGVMSLYLNYSTSDVLIFGMVDNEWEKLTTLSFPDPVQDIFFRNNVLYLGVGNFWQNNLPYVAIYESADNGYHWKETALIQIEFPPGRIWNTITMSVTEDGSGIIVSSVATSYIQSNIWFLQEMDGEWVVSGTFVPNLQVTSIAAYGNNFVVGGQMDYIGVPGYLFYWTRENFSE